MAFPRFRPDGDDFPKAYRRGCIDRMIGRFGETPETVYARFHGALRRPCARRSRASTGRPGRWVEGLAILGLPEQVASLGPDDLALAGGPIRSCRPH